MKNTIATMILSSLVLCTGCGASHNGQQNKSNNTRNNRVNRIKTASGLEYEVISSGNGAAPKKGQTITAHYTGWLNEGGKKGKQFDSSVDRGQPLQFPVGISYVIPGWDEGLMLMKVGDTFRFFIPAKLGYGARGAGNVIPPNADLIFEVELISVG